MIGKRSIAFAREAKDRMTPSPVPTSRFNRGAWLHLILMLLWIAFAAGSTIYRFALPTDGWLAAEPDEFNGFGYIYAENIMDVPSGLQPGDHLVAVEGIPITGGITSALWSLKDAWTPANSMRYTVLRAGHEQEIDAELTNWNLRRFLESDSITAAAIASFLGLFIFLVMGFLTFWLRPDVPAARALWVLSAAIFSTYLVTLYPSMVPDNVFPLAGMSLVLSIFATFTILLPPAFIRFALVFPRPVPILQRHPWIAYLPYVVGIIGIGAFLAEFYVFGFAWTAISILIALVLLIYNAVTMRDAVSRAQLRWGLGGVIVGLALFFVTYIPVFFDVPDPVTDFANTTGLLGFGVMGIALAIAILRYRLFDIDVIIRKTLTYAILTTLLALVYFGSVIALQTIVGRTFSEQSSLTIVISTLLIAALFVPLRNWVQNFIDRRFFRRKYDAQQALASFAQSARNEVELETLTADLMQTVAGTLQPQQVTIWLQPESVRESP